jgi:hypothetical protein
MYLEYLYLEYQGYSQGILIDAGLPPEKKLMGEKKVEITPPDEF